VEQDFTVDFWVRYFSVCQKRKKEKNDMFASSKVQFEKF
jgi:hypothetical protein